MRPIKLKMSAFGPYVEPLELNFERELGGANFFLINGATGSGKTTIIDAICYALYGEDFGGKDGRKGSIMRSEQALPTLKTEIEFTFSLRGKIYRIVRSPRYERAKFRGEGVTEEKAYAEIYEDGNFVETKDVSDYVKNLLQFDCEQFRQVVVLPQGEFKKFLTAKSGEKQEVLDMLFNAEFFKRVEDELKLKADDAKKTFTSLNEHKKTLLEETGAAEEELPALMENLLIEFEVAQGKLKTLEAQVLDAQKKFNDGENLSKKFADLELKSRELDAAQKLLEKISCELSAAKTELDKRTAEAPQRKELEQLVVELDKKKISLEKLKSKRCERDKAEKATKASAAEVERLLKLKKNCDDLMLKLKTEAESLQDAPAKLKVAEQKLKEAQAYEKLLAEIKKLHLDISAAEKDLIAVQKSQDAEEKRLDNLRELQISGSAARLATTLEEGKPCPVCGAIHHPTPAISEYAIPTDAQIKAAESKVRALTEEKNLAAKNLAGLKSKLETKEKDLADKAEVLTVAEAQAEVAKLSEDVKTLTSHRKRIQNGEVKTRETEENLSAAQAKDKSVSGEFEKLRGEVAAMTREVDGKYLSDDKLIDVEISSAQNNLNKLNAAFQTAQEKFNQLEKNLAAQNSTVEAAQKNKAEVAAQVKEKDKPDISVLKKILDEARAAERSAIETKTKLSTRIERLKDILKKISEIADKLKVADKNFLMWKTLSDVASGKTSTKISFQRYYLATMFKEVIEEANNRLEKMSGGRYRFKNKEDIGDRRRKAGLDLEILDEYTGTARPVETLSGGESFLASLSLALGLAAVVQNNSGGIKLDTIFIDEGFGTLDIETLDFAMKALIELQSDGRLVGIISHVEELKNQIPVRLEVFKTKTGSTAKFIV